MSLLMKVQPVDSVRTFIRFSILDGVVSRNSVVALNALVLDPPNSLLDGELVQEIVSTGITTAKDTDVKSGWSEANVRISFPNLGFCFSERY